MRVLRGATDREVSDSHPQFPGNTHPPATLRSRSTSSQARGVWHMKISWSKQPGSMSRRAALQGDGIADPQATLGKQRHKSWDAEFDLHNRCTTA